MNDAPLTIASLANPHVKRAVRLRQRSHRDELGLMLIEGYRELLRATDNRHMPSEVFVCRELFLGENEDALVRRCAEAGAQVYECSRPVFEKMSYRDRPDGLLAVAAQVRRPLDSIELRPPAFVVVAESIEKPGNLGTILRSADAAGVQAVLVCDRCTDVNNPNVVRASIGTLFSLPVVETGSGEALAWLKTNGIQIVAATPHADLVYSDADFTRDTAIVLGTEQYGLSDAWFRAADCKIRIPMLGQADSLNVASATTILLYEVVRQRSRKEQR